MTYDHWKTTEPDYDSGNYPPEDETEVYDRAFAKLSATCLDLKAERDKYEAALRKIAAWKGYTGTEHVPLGEYEEGANDMLEMLSKIASEALS